MLEPIQLLIKINHAVQSNKDLQQKTTVLANANSKSFDQILSLFNFLQTSPDIGIIEKTSSLKRTEMEGMNLQNPDNISEADWLELDTILQELFGLYQQFLPTVQPNSQAENWTTSTSLAEASVSPTVLQAIGDVQTELTQWLDKVGGIQQLTQNDKNQLIQRIAQYANELTNFTKINQTLTFDINSRVKEFAATTPTTEQAQAHAPHQINQVMNSRTGLEQSNILEQMISLFGIAEQAEMAKNSTSNIRDGTTKVEVNPLFVRANPKSLNEFQLEQRFINTSVQMNSQTLQPVLPTERYLVPFSNGLLTEEIMAGTIMNNLVQETNLITANQPNDKPGQLNQPSNNQTQISEELGVDFNKIKIDKAAPNHMSQEQEDPIQTLKVARETETETETGILSNKPPVTEIKKSQSTINSQQVVEQVVTQATENKPSQQKQAVDMIAKGRAQVFVDASPPDKRKTSEGIPRQDNSSTTQPVEINVQPTTNETIVNSDDSALEHVIKPPLSDRQVNQAIVMDKAYTTLTGDSQLALTDTVTAVTIDKALPENALITERIQTNNEQLNNGNNIQYQQQQETAPIRISGTSAQAQTTQAQTTQAQTTQAQTTLTLSSFVPEVSEWMGRFFKITSSQSGSSEAKFSMYPEHLGHLEIKIAAQKGHITAQILTDTQTAKEALEGQLSMLKQALQQQGLQVQKIEIVQHVPTAPESNYSNNLSFSQGGSNQQQFNQSNEQAGYTASQTVSNFAEKEDETIPIENDKAIPAFTYGGKQVRTTSRIDFSA